MSCLESVLTTISSTKYQNYTRNCQSIIDCLVISVVTDPGKKRFEKEKNRVKDYSYAPITELNWNAQRETLFGSASLRKALSKS